MQPRRGIEHLESDDLAVLPVEDDDRLGTWRCLTRDAVAGTHARGKTFLHELLTDEPPFLDVWLHRDDGGPWLIASLDFIEGDAVGDTLRLDFDGRAIGLPDVSERGRFC